MKVSDYVSEFLVSHGIGTVFTVVGGGAMHLNDSFGHHKDLHCVYNHHEQASAMAAEAYYRINNEMAAVCVTSGPGAINALNGVCGAYQDSIPMLIISGQVKSTLTVKHSGLKLRTLGGQEFNIVPALTDMTKYAVMLERPEDIRFCLEKAYHIALSGRPGPCWLDIPVDIQGAMVDETSLRGYNGTDNLDEVLAIDELGDKVRAIIDRLKNAKRPVLYAGNGIRIAGAVKELKKFVNKSGIPVVTCWDSIDLMDTEDGNFCGRGGMMGDRPGNFAVQNSDFLLCIGSRLSIYQVGYNVDTWAREAYVIDVDIDPEELKKPTIRVDLSVCADALEFLKKLNSLSEKQKIFVPDEWRCQCEHWKLKYPVVDTRHYKTEGKTNVYAFVDTLSKSLPMNAITVVSNGSASVVGSQSYYIGKGQRFIMNCALSSMGYGLPAAIGACEANNRKSVICIEGDGSIQMNIQELQTVVTNKLPVKIFVINNEGYHQIRQTQNNIFHTSLIGVGPESGDLEFPDFKKIAWAYGIPYCRIENNDKLKNKIDEVLSSELFYICEVMCSTDQIFEPKAATRKHSDGTLFSPALEDLAPYLTREELKRNMYIKLVEEV